VIGRDKNGRGAMAVKIGVHDPSLGQFEVREGEEGREGD